MLKLPLLTGKQIGKIIGPRLLNKIIKQDLKLNINEFLNLIKK